MTAILLPACVATSMLAQASKQNSAAPIHASDSASASPSAPAPLATAYPLDSFRDFSAIMVGSRAEPGEGRSTGHIYRSGDQIRMEEPGGRAYFVTDLHTGETYGIMASNCMRDDHPYIRAIPFYMAGIADATVTRAPSAADPDAGAGAPVEKETLDGHSCHVEEITVSSPAFPNPQKMKLWEAEDLQGFPIKIEFVLPRGHGPIIRYKNVVLGPQDPTLFIHPKSCQPLPAATDGPTR